MNDPNRKIEIDKSSLLSLKAELLRKQEEVSRAKAFTSIDDFVPKKVPKAEKSYSSDKKEPKSKTEKNAIELEDSAQLERSKKKLVVKAKYYDRMVASGGALNSDENCLVMFNQKRQTEKPMDNSYGSSDDSISLEEEGPRETEIRRNNPNEDWVEYTDFLGRSRRCLRRDLDECLRKDKELSRCTSPREGQRNAKTQHLESESDDDGNIIGPVPSVAITEDTIGDRFREMREQWATQEAENLEKDSVHYQDVLFDEARQHGVGYYAFSTDREERDRQQRELDSIRDGTIEAQKEKEDLRKARDRIIADRMKAAKARQRARLGLPPEEEVPAADADATVEDELYDTMEDKKRTKAEAKARKKKEKEERKKERERQKHVRPWDEGKQKDDEMEWKPAKEWHVMSQDEWNEMKRKERICEFAPPKNYSASSKENARYNFPQDSGNNLKNVEHCRVDNDDDDDDDEDEDDNKDESIDELHLNQYPHQNEVMHDNPLSSSFKETGDEEVSMPSIPGMEEIFLPEESNRTLFFTTKKQKKEFKRRNYDNSMGDGAPEKKTKPQESVPIRKELTDDSDGESERNQGESGVEIAPPPTYDYYGPTSTGTQRRSRQPPVAKTALESSIEAGLRFLRQQSDKGGPSMGTKNKWSSNANY
ncbi:coiled-coil domain-containing protein 174 [Toxorhynchites rutilus septentrionalis]|uniref:coiled-coil domain-containing protein 174 n=1 Tax=Toxorhynchites rutilus septentrionalis TaxID=329112 RepID=UPI00247A6853|nr:coiled-coil domain-containing protein 174 [Toxorhynchites rutilus septentrionalis]